ncbi:transglycosylase SLT domain-containing protein [Methylobacterium sp. A54F]
MAYPDTMDPGAPDADFDAAVQSGDLRKLYALLEQEGGLPAGFLGRTAQIESRGNPNAKNPNSSAEGLFQFINSTGRNYGLNSSADKRDPVLATLAAAQLAGDNQDYLRQRLGRDPTGGELYLAHQQGSGGAANLLANPNASAAAVVGGDAARLNAGGGLSAGQLASRWTSKFDGASPVGGSTMIAGNEGSGTLTGGSGADTFSPSAYAASKPADSGFNAGNLMTSIGLALLSGNRFNPLGNLPTILQSQMKAQQDRDALVYQRSKDERAFQTGRQDAAQSQANTDRSYGLQERSLANSMENTKFSQGLQREQLDLAKDKANAPDLRTDPATGATISIDKDGKVTSLTPGKKSTYDQNMEDGQKAGLTGAALQAYGLTGQLPANSGVTMNPYANPGGGKQTEAELKSGGFADRMFQNEQTFRGLQKDGETTLEDAVGTSRLERAPGSVPVIGGALGSFFNSDAYRSYKSAKENWIAAQLRKESGAAIGQSEYDAADRQYFPLPGDPAAEVERKRKLRQTATEGMARDAGASYRPKFIYDGEGKLQDYKVGQQGSPLGQSPAVQSAPPAAAISALRSDRSRRAEFDAKYGPGAADSILGSQ